MDNYDLTYTGAEIQAILDTAKKLKDSGYIFLGVATPSTNPGTPTQKVYYEAKQAGTYTNFGGAVLPDGISLLIWDGSWTLETVMCGDGGVFDITAYKSSGGTLAKYADLAAALDGGNNIPVGVRKGGMSVKFVQSSDNKYMQARCMSQSFTTDVTQWQGVEDNVVFGSKNVITSGGVFRQARKELLGLNVTIVGDSISTYQGYVGSNPHFYPYGDVRSVEDTWWYNLCRKTGGTIKENLSYAGARIVNDGINPSILTYVGNAQSTNIFFIAGGQNDSQNDVAVGTLDFTKETENLDDTKFADAYLHCVRIAISKADKVVCLITDQVQAKYVKIIKSICTYYNLTCIDTTITFVGKAHTSHPNKQGMRMICECALTQLFGYNIDDEPKANSQNPVRSGGTYNAILNSSKEVKDIIVNRGIEPMLAAPAVVITGNKVDYRLSTDIVQNTGVAFSGGYRAAVLSFIPIISNVNISIANGFQFNIIWYSDANESSYVGTTNYVQQSSFNKPDTARYFRIVIQRTGNASKVTENFDTIVTSLTLTGFYGRINTINNNAVFKWAQSFTDEEKAQIRSNIRSMPYRNVTYMLCSSAADAVEKTISVDQAGNAFNIGMRFIVNMRYSNTADNVTISINGGTAVPLYYNDVRASSTNKWNAGDKLDIIFDGTNAYANKYHGISDSRGDSQRVAISQKTYTIDMTAIEKKVNDYIEKMTIDNTLLSATPYPINSYTTWLQGSTDDTSNVRRRRMNYMIPVVAGHTYMIEWSHKADTLVNSFRPEFGNSKTDGNTTQKGTWQYHLYNKFTVPYGFTYLRLTFIKDANNTFTEEEVVSCDFHLIDVTGSQIISENGGQIVSWNYDTSSYAQGLACWGGYIFQAWSNGKLSVYKKTGELVVDRLTLPTAGGSTLHCNALSWGEKYDSADEFPVLIVASNNWGTKMLGVRITRNDNEFTLTSVYEITAPTAPEGYTSATQYVDTKATSMVVGGYDADGNVAFSNYTWTGTLGADTEFTLSRTVQTGLYLYAMQDGVCKDNKLYFLYGTTNNKVVLGTYNLSSRKLMNFVDLRRTIFGMSGEEPQGIDYNDGDIYISTIYGIYKVSVG